VLPKRVADELGVGARHARWLITTDPADVAALHARGIEAWLAAAAAADTTCQVCGHLEDGPGDVGCVCADGDCGCGSTPRP
jgi:hypothetical protein